MLAQTVTKRTRAKRLITALAIVSLAACASNNNAPGSAAPDVNMPAATAVPELAQFGRFVGTWACSVQQRQADGSWQTQPGQATWRWQYTLGGHAVQDFWQPADAGDNPAGLGTNLRTWDRSTQRWDVVWTTAAQQGVERLTARAAGANMVLNTTKQGRDGRPGHQARITFFDIQAAQFDWIYEASPIDDGQRWSALVQMRCKRQ